MKKSALNEMITIPNEFKKDQSNIMKVIHRKAALYIRVSTHHQIDKDSLPFQRQELCNYIKYALGIDDYEIFEDAGYSAKNTDRPKYQEMMSRIRNGEFTHLVVWKIDRISRNLRDFTEMWDELNDYKVTFVSRNEQFDTSSAMGEAMLKIILVFAELERKLAAERSFEIMLSRAAKGLWNGATVPIGYVWSEEIKFPVIDEEESKVVQYIFDLYEELRSTGKVAYRLNKERVPTKRGGTWTAKTVGDILRNPFYIGTYRYNIKDEKGRLKDESEHIIIPNNHPGIIDPEQFARVNTMIDENYKGNHSYQRECSNVHAFAGILKCGKCGSSFVAGLDAARKDGYKPSRYSCSSSQRYDSIHSCGNFVSDITLFPFILNYISNFINLQEKITPNHSLRDMERILLRGSHFVDVEGIDKKGLEETYLAFAGGFQDRSYANSNDAPEESAISLEFESLKKDKIKYEKALQRLEDLFLFSDEAMSQKDFLFKKRDMVQHIENINNQLAALHKKDLDSKLTTDIAFLNKASVFLMNQHMSSKRNIDYRELLEVVDAALIKDFINIVVNNIVVTDKQVLSITFQNGITHKFLYKPKEQHQNRPKTKFEYRSYETMIIDYLKENGSVARKDVEALTGMGRTGAGSLLSEFMERGIVERKGHSIAIRYFLIEEKTT